MKCVSKGRLSIQAVTLTCKISSLKSHKLRLVMGFTLMFPIRIRTMCKCYWLKSVLNITSVFLCVSTSYLMYLFIISFFSI